MKKYLCTGILLGTFVLVGCNLISETKGHLQVKENEENVNKQVQVEEIKKKTEDTTHEKEVRIKPLIEYEKVDISNPRLKLSQERRESYYRQYGKIVEQVNAENDGGIELLPISEFKEEDWVELEDFERIASSMANLEFTSDAFGGDPVE